MGGLLIELKNNSIITADAVSRLKNHIYRKYSSLSLSRQAVILADDLNKALEVRLPKFEDILYKRLKRLLLERAVKKSAFEIYCSDIFLAAVELRETNKEFFDQLDTWLSENLEKSLSREQLVKLVMESHRLSELHPEMNLAEAIKTAETMALHQKIEDTVIAPDLTHSIEIEEITEPYITADQLSEEIIEPYVVLEQFTPVFMKPRMRARNKNLLAAAAAVVLLFGAPLLLGLDNMSDKSAPDSKYSTEAIVLSNSLYGRMVSEKESTADSVVNAGESKLKMKATAYDLSATSCGKLPGEPGYGITSTGTKAKVGRTVAVDPEVVPLGSRLLITFPDEYKHLDGVYIAEDTGRLIKGSSIDIFFGEDKDGGTDINKKAMEFGVRYVNVEILRDSNGDS